MRRNQEKNGKQNRKQYQGQERDKEKHYIKTNVLKKEREREKKLGVEESKKRNILKAKTFSPQNVVGNQKQMRKAKGVQTIGKLLIELNKQ